MPAPAARNVTKVFRSIAKIIPKKKKSTPLSAAFSAKNKPPSSSAAKKKPSPPSSSSASDDAVLKEYVSGINYSSNVSKSTKTFLKSFKASPSSTAVSTPTASFREIISDGLNPHRTKYSDVKQLATDASRVLSNELDFELDDESEEDKPDGLVLDLPWLSTLSNNSTEKRRGVSRERKQKWVFKSSQAGRFDRLVKMCAKKLGSESVIELFGKLQRQSSLKDYNALINACVDKARAATDENASLDQIYNAYQILKAVRENGFQIEEETYGRFLLYLIDFEMVEEFFFFRDLITMENPDSLPRLAYYEMLLWVGVNNEEKIQELYHESMADGSQEKYCLREQLLMALGNTDRREQFLMLLENVDITNITTVSSLVCVFKSLGKFLLEPFAERYLLALKTSDIGADNISNFICEYAFSIPNMAVEDVIMKFQSLHAKLEVLPTSAQYVKLIRYCCECHKVHEALKVVDKAIGSGVPVSLEAFHSILDACKEDCEFNLVRQIYSVICGLNLKPNKETFRLIILLYVKMKDFKGANGMINELEKWKLSPTASMFNIILAGYFREKDVHSARNVLKQMEDADVKPDEVTFSYLIANSKSEEKIIKFYDEMIRSGVRPTKQVFMALINAYAACGEFDKAAQVILDERIPTKNLNEIKSVLVGALASNGQLSHALKMYEEIKEAECNLEPKAIRSLIEHFQSEGDLNKSLQLLGELKGSPYWVDACFRVISCCIEQENLRSTIDLLGQLKDKFTDEEVLEELMFEEVFCILAETEPKRMQFGLGLLKVIKEELHVRPSRKSLDFLLSACVYAKDAEASFVIWKEYETAGLPYNVLSYLRMYQALLASGDEKSAANILTKIPKDDPHVRSVIKACDDVFMKSAKKKKRKNKTKWGALMETLGLAETSTT